MNKKRVLATAMSALMIVSSTPVAAIAEVANQPSAAGAVAAGLNPDANGSQELNAALGDTANGDSLPGGGSSRAATAAPAFTPKGGQIKQAITATAEGDEETVTYIDDSDLAKLVSWGQPTQDDRGRWVVTVTVNVDALKAHVNFAIGDYNADDLEWDGTSKNTIEFRTDSATSKTYSAFGADRAKINYVKKAAEQAPAAPTAEELENVYGAVTFGGDATSTLPAYLEDGYYTPAKAVEKQADGTYTFTVTVPNTKEAAAKYLEQKGGSADDLEYDDKTSTTTVIFAYDAAAKTWGLNTPAKLVLNKKPAPAITKDNFDFSQDAVRVRDDDSDDTLDTLPLIDGTYDLSKLDMTKYTNVGGALVIDLPITDAQKYVDAYNEAHPDTYYALASENAGSVVLRYYQGKWGVSEPTSVYVKQGEKPASKAAIELNTASATVSEYGLTKLGDLGVNTWVKKVTLADGTVVAADDYWKTTNPVIKDASGNEHTLADGLKPGEYTITYTLDDGSATATLKLTVTASTYDLEAKADDNLSLADAQKLASDKAFIDKYVTKAQTSDGEDFKGDVTVSVYKDSVDPNNHLTAPQFAAQAKDGGTYIVVFEYDPDHTEPYLATAQTTLTIGTPAEQADLHVFGNPGDTTVESATLSAQVGQKLSDVEGFELNPTKDGWKFDGWFLDKEYTKPANGDTTVGSAWFAVYAKWERTNSYAMEAKASAEYTTDEAKAAFGYKGSYKNGDANIAKALITKAQVNGKDLDVTADLTGSDPQLKVNVWKNGSNGFFDLVAGKEGSYTVTFKLGDKTATTAVTIKANNGGGNGGGSTGGNGGGNGGSSTPSTPSYKVVLPETIDGGSVETNGTSFKSGQTVTVKPASKDGYRLAGLKVTDKDGKQLTITDGADGAYAFEMPSSDVTLEPVFTKVEPKSFADVADGQWYKPGVDYASANGLMNGYEGSNDFGVGKSLTRGELATLLFNNAKPGDSFNDYRLSKNQTGLPDVVAGQFYTPAANWAVKNQVVNGYADAQGNRTGFGPNDAVTLEQLLAILSNYADKDGAQGADTSVLNGFVDGASVDPWAAKSVAWAVQKGLVHGYDTPEGKRLDPIQTISRERVATVLLNAKTLGIL